MAGAKRRAQLAATQTVCRAPSCFDAGHAAWVADQGASLQQPACVAGCWQRSGDMRTSLLLRVSPCYFLLSVLPKCRA
jgi:hypothetical protein